MSDTASILAIADEFLVNDVLPKANEMDTDVDLLREGLDGLCARRLMALRRPLQYGGPEIDEASFRTFQESVARYSGSLAFLQTQHQSAVAMLARNASDEMREETLPLMDHAQLLMGIGFSQLRRPGEPIMRARPEGNRYILDGEVPWITGYGLFHEFLIGATLPDGQALFAIVPLHPMERDGGQITFSEPMRLAAMQSAQTVSAKLSNWRVEPAFIKPAGWIQGNDMINVTLQGFFALGCARAGIDIVEEAHVKRGAPFLRDTADRLLEELDACRTQMADSYAPIEDRLKVRAWGIDLAVRCAHAGVTVSSGFANSIRSRAQRVYREALVYTVSAQTTAIMESTLNRLVARGGLG
jgi:alkylation response protein AidB-like acyl-CoA dehydrogenase